MNILYFLSNLDTKDGEQFLTLWMRSINARRVQSRRRELDESVVRSFLSEYGDDRFVSEADQKHRSILRMKGRIQAAASRLGIPPAEYLDAMIDSFETGDENHD